MKFEDLFREYREHCDAEAARAPFGREQMDALWKKIEQSELQQNASESEIASNEVNQKAAIMSVPQTDSVGSARPHGKGVEHSIWKAVFGWLHSPALGWATACLAVGFVVLHDSNKTAVFTAQTVATTGNFGTTRGIPPEKTRGGGNDDAPMDKVNIGLKWETGVITFTDTTGVRLSGHFKPEEPRPTGAQPGVEYYSIVAAGFQFGPNSRTNDWLLTGTMSLTRSPGTNAPTEAELLTLQVRGFLFEQGSAKRGGEVTFSGPRAPKP